MALGIARRFVAALAGTVWGCRTSGELRAAEGVHSGGSPNGKTAGPCVSSGRRYASPREKEKGGGGSPQVERRDATRRAWLHVGPHLQTRAQTAARCLIG